MWQQLITGIESGDVKSLARSISFIENEIDGFEELLGSLKPRHIPIIGITGPPGAGKSTLVDALIGEMVKQQKKVAVICVDPSSPFNFGALLGDRIRLSEWYQNENVFIRSLATRGSLGGLHPKIIEITDLLRSGVFDFILVETVGVGQSEVEIVGLADCTVVVLVPEGGDEIQTMKAGLMEIADIFVVNKTDRPGADSFVKNLRQMLAPVFSQKEIEVPIIKTIASQKEGIPELYENIKTSLATEKNHDKKNYLLATKSYQLIQKNKMKGVDKKQLLAEIETLADGFNLYQFIKKYS